jgi:hypothetical protein
MELKSRLVVKLWEPKTPATLSPNETVPKSLVPFQPLRSSVMVSVRLPESNTSSGATSLVLLGPAHMSMSPFAL